MAENAIRLVNRAAHDVRIAILPTWTPAWTRGTFAWLVFPLAKGDSRAVEIPSACDFLASFGAEADAWRGQQSNTVRIAAGTRKITAQEHTNSETGPTVHLAVDAVAHVGMRVEFHNWTTSGLWLHMLKRDVDVVPPVPVAPGRKLYVDTGLEYWVAVVEAEVAAGRPAADQHVIPKAIRVELGATAQLTGPFADGYVFDVSPA